MLLTLAPASAAAQPVCGFVFGFAALKGLLGATMGDPATCEYADPNGSGDTLQNTTTGLAFWRKSTNTPTFTDGWNHWGLTPVGLISWSGPSIDPPSASWTPPPPTKTTACVISAGLPDAGCTPGAVDARVTQDNIQATICQPGYTQTVRPPTSYTTPLKRQLMAAYGLTDQPLADYELDHLISLEIGGDPRSPANLWPEPWGGPNNAHQKDAIENFLHRQVCAGVIALSDAQREIATAWSSVSTVRSSSGSPYRASAPEIRIWRNFLAASVVRGMIEPRMR